MRKAPGGCARSVPAAFHLDSLILPDDEVADFEVEGFFLPRVHA